MLFIHYYNIIMLCNNIIYFTVNGHCQNSFGFTEFYPTSKGVILKTHYILHCSTYLPSATVKAPTKVTQTKHNCTKNKTKSCMIDNIFIPLNQFRVQKMVFACALPERNSQNFPRQYPMQQLGWSRVQNQVHNQAQILDLSLDKHV